MAKVKNKRNAGAADRANQKRKAEANKKKLNPFEVHINREKHHVLGKKSKHDRGLPGVSRAKAIQKRKETLGTEMKLMHKTNAFIDKRIGEKDNALSAEDRMVARFAAERAKQHGRKNIYNLADDEVLTHRGQTLEQIEKFDDPRSDEEDEAGFKGLDDDFVSEGHFGGGVLQKSDKDGAKSHKDLIEQLIAESKKRKAEKQKEKEQTLDLTEKLDSEWKDLQPVVFKRARVEEESAIDKVLNKAEKNSQDYDKMMRELRFEKRGTPSDAVKTDEKLEKEEKERIAQLEKERERRMLGDDELNVQPKSKHRSADDLDDNFELDDEKDFMLAYDKDGKPLVPEHILKDYSVPKSKMEFDDGLTESSDDENEEEKGESDDDEDESEGSDENEEQDTKTVNAECKIESNKKKAQKEKSILFRDSDSSEENDSDENDDEAMKPSKQIGKETTKHEKVNDDDKVETESSDNSESSKNEECESTKETLRNSTKKVSEAQKEINLKENDDDSMEDSETEDVAVKVKINNASVNQNENTQSVDDNGESEDESSEDSDEEDNVKKEINTTTTEKSKIIKTSNSESEEDSSEDDSSETESEMGNNVQKVLKTEKRQKLIGDSESEEEREVDDEHLKSFLGKTTEYENFKKLLSNKTPTQQSTALQKLIKSYDPSLGENNKDKLSKLFANMLQYVNDLFTNLKDEGAIMKAFLTLDKICPYFYDINQINKVSSRKFFAELLTEKHEEFRKRPKKIPNLDTIIFFKLISLLYPTSDFRHPVTTPSLTFMSQILTTCKFRDAYAISRGMFVTTLILEYTILSKRYVPAAINFIRGILYLSAKTTVLNPIQVVPPFRLHKDDKILNLEEDCSKLDVGWKMELKDLVADSIDNKFKIRTLLNATLMLKVFFDNCNEMEAQECIFEPHIKLLSRLELELYPKKVASTIEGVLKYMKDTLEVKTYRPLSSDKPKPKTLRLYEPDIQEVFTGNKSSKLSRETAERQRLQHRYKREMKGALREIRRDKAYIASVKIKDKIHSDNIRKDKVKQIYKDASIQQGELNKLKRGK